MYKCRSIISIVPTVGAKFKMYTIVKFLDIIDARYFKHILHDRKQTDAIMAKVKTIRWSITSAQLSAGQADFIYDIQCQIVKYYNISLKIRQVTENIA